MDKVAAIVMRRYGPPDVLGLGTVAMPPPAADEVRIRSIASAVNHSDLEIRAGHWRVRKPDPFPYVPGLEVVGDVVEVGRAVADVRVGDRVITMQQGLGGVRAERPGGYAEYVTVAATAVARVPAGVDPYDMAALGLVGVTAYEGLRCLGQLGGRRIVVTGASGGVGSAAIAIARVLGATVIAMVSRPERAEYVRSVGAHEVLIGSPASLQASLGEESVDGVLDTVAGELFGSLVTALRPGGTLSLVGAVGGNQVGFDVWPLMLPVTLTGYSSESLDGDALRRAVAALGDWLGRGTLKPPARRVMPLSEAAAAHALLERRAVEGRLLLSFGPL